MQNDFPSFNFQFSIEVATVDNLMREHSSMDRMNQSCNFKINLPWSDEHFSLRLKCSLLEWLSSPDAWQLTTQGGHLHREDVFPHSEWVDCPDCGEQIPSDMRSGHGCTFEGELPENDSDA